MKIVKSHLIILIVNLLISQLTNAEIRLPEIVASNMVLQRNITVNVWGWAGANEKISLKLSWQEEPINVRADKYGNWKTEILTTKSKDPQTITLTSETSNILLENILFGEVWLCSGQSNMYQPLKGYVGQPTYGSLQAIINSKNSNLRLFSVSKAGASTPQKSLKESSGWLMASPENVSNFSAVAYFYGKQLQQILDVPVGLIHSSFGGSSVKAWLSKQGISPYEKVNIENKNISSKARYTPTALFNAMINPLIPYTLKGVLWYQGESNRTAPEAYKKLFPAMVKDWRAIWGQDDFPFYYVQIAPHSYAKDKKMVNTAYLREAQLKSLDLINNSGMVITMDLGDKDSVHPPKKKEVADRLLYLALNKTYKINGINPVSPQYDSMTLKDNRVILKFKNAKQGLYTYNGLDNFIICGENRVFYPAEAKILNKNEVEVYNENVKKPVAVRYAWNSWSEASLFGANELPVSSFRTDSWNDFKKE
ncbi:hypothetical protein PW52_15070 [Tamlana sedimentorum]|uniref:Sialate O-acetylesterase domain-containing protein n=1 Tax=Neotamlana sedimentorum TaxID=1435349 RepID=A0A0D7W4T4_9FLAO|nr:sialate O-acetylesterase [Tamlana sedimentorum]KJD32797.1 hypothetical protein PW52_15070 [Tamlana sedimentorum]